MRFLPYHPTLGRLAKAERRHDPQMPRTDVAVRFKALYPEELVERYRDGERDFTGINLLREELERIFRVRGRLPTPEDWQSEAYETPRWFMRGFTAAVNPLWADYRQFEPQFEWDYYGSFIPIELDDIPTKDLSNLDLSGINLRGAYLY